MPQQRNSTRQTTQSSTKNRVHQDYASVENSDGVSFSQGNMLVDGQQQVPEEAQRWESSNGLSIYTAVKWRDPATGDHRVSCNCPGWAIKRGEKLRRCKHTDDMMGISICKARKVDGLTPIRTIAEAEAAVPQFNGRPLRGIMLD